MGILDDAIREHLELKRRHGADSQEVSRQEREILGGESSPTEASAAAAYEQPAALDVPPAAIPEPLAPAELPADEAPVAPPVPEPLAGSPLLKSDPTRPVDDLFPGTGELLAAASESPPAAPSRPLAAPAPSGADSETAARSGARRLSDDELAAWRRRLSERADRLAAQRPGTEPTAPSAPAAPAPSKAPREPEPPKYWSGNTTGSDAGAIPPATPAAKETAQHAPIHDPEPPVSGVPVDFFDAADAADAAFAPEAAPEPVVDTEHDVLDETPDFLEETPEHDRMWFEQRPPRDFDFG